ncbi:hypothetical protein Tco_0848500 [Tanacetum coccineum]
MEDPRESFNELMDTPLDFSAFVMNRLKFDTLTPELLTGPTFKLMKVSCKSLVELEYFFKEVYKATTDQLDWNNPEGQQYPHDLRKPLPLIPNYSRQIDKFSQLKKRLPFMYPNNVHKEALSIKRHVEDIKEAYTAYSNPRGFIYQNKDKKNRLMRIDELHKFSDGTLNDVWTALNDRLKGIQMQYLLQTIWRQSDKDKVGAMIQSNDKQLKTRRIMRSLEKFVVLLIIGIHVDDKLQFVEEPVEIMEREIKRLKRSRIPLVKVRWNSRRGPEFTWEREDSFKQKYPQLFTNRASSSTTRS